MFEKFGLMDVFSALKRHKIVISVILVLSIVFGAAIGVSKINAADNTSVISDKKQVYIATASYYIDPTVEFTDENLSGYKSLPAQFSNILNADFCQKYVFDKLIKNHTKEDLIKKTMLSNDSSFNANPEELNMYCLEKVFYANQYENTMVIQLFAESYDEQLSLEILSYYQSYLVDQYAPKTEIASVVFVDTTNQKLLTENNIIKSLKEADKDSTKDVSLLNNSASVNPIKTMIKWIGVMLILGIVLSAAIVFVIALFNPTLNRKCDFLEYDIPIIGELNVCKKSKRRKV